MCARTGVGGTERMRERERVFSRPHPDAGLEAGLDWGSTGAGVGLIPPW